MVGEKKIFAQTVFTGNSVLKEQLITCTNGYIHAIEPGEKEQATILVANLAPGFFDIQVNGGEHFHFTAKPDTLCLADMEKACIDAGTAYVLPTLITSSIENIFKGIDAVRSYQQQHPTSAILGMHLEGPFIHVKKRGAHLTKYILKPDKKLIEEIVQYGHGTILQMTIAPEVFDEDTLHVLLDAGMALSVGHTNATYAEAMAAFDLGIHQVTHLFNAMSPLQHREPGVVGAALDHHAVFTPVVLDGKHVSFAAARIAAKVKREKFFLISDALFLGRKKQHFQWEEFDAQLIQDEYLNSEGNLAGAAISLADAVVNAVQYLGVSVQEAVEMATSRAAKAVKQKGIAKIMPGYPARFTTFTDALNEFKVLSL
ncbi:N-acetylglucosamine-6-phosphate deacetylase [Olivibacter ginsenosidimutans]|uniref:N-acetylglucosamine-6-phosphate deacetylase n=1 Tax=Olivibacter ginsenosidimutans TaxID=1176537 RepID=A0ABP9BC64_9SPHI